MIAIDREPTANIVTVPALPEGLSSNTIQPQVPDIFYKAFERKPLDFLHPIKSAILPIGRNRFYSKLSLGFTKIKDSLDKIKYYYRGRGGRGPCQACETGAEDNHNGGSKCRKRGTVSFSYKSLLPNVNIFKSASILSGSR